MEDVCVCVMRRVSATHKDLTKHTRHGQPARYHTHHRSARDDGEDRQRDVEGEARHGT